MKCNWFFWIEISFLVSCSVPFPILMTTVTLHKIPAALTEKICRLSEGSHDLFQRDRQSMEKSCFYSHCKRIWEQMTSEERNSIRHAIKNETARFNQLNCYESLLDSYCVKQIGTLIRESGCYPLQSNSLIEFN